MGCATQINKKTDNRGTCTYHSVDGWYLSTSPEHYRTHLCYVRSTRIKRLTNTVKFRHKHITNHIITHANKVMNAVADCTKAVKDMEVSSGSPEISQLKQLVALMKQAVLIQTAVHIDTHQVPRVQSPTPAVPRVQALPMMAPPLDKTTTRTTRLMARAATPIPQQADDLRPPITPSPPACNTRAQKVATANSTAPPSTPPAHSTRAQKSATTKPWPFRQAI